MSVRREQLLHAATDLFASRGYHGVGIDDVGAAAGISGPGVYRHFLSKQALLEALCERAMTRMLAVAAALPAAGDDPQAALDGLVELHVGFAVHERELLAVWVREQRALPEQARRTLRGRQRAYEAIWRAVVAALRDDLTDDEVTVCVGATLAMLNATALFETKVPADRLRALLRDMALAALLPPAATAVS